MADESFIALINAMFAIIAALAFALGCVGGALIFHAIRGHTEILDVMERYRTGSTRVPGTVLGQERHERTDPSGSDVSSRKRIVYKIRYRYEAPPNGGGAVVVREFESPKELQVDGFSVSALLPEHPNSGLPTEHIESMTGRAFQLASVFKVLFFLLGCTCFGVSLYAIKLLEEPPVFVLAVISLLFLIIGKALANAYLQRWKKEMLEDVLSEEGDLIPTNVDGQQYGSI